MRLPEILVLMLMFRGHEFRGLRHHSPTHLSMNTSVFHIKEREGARRMDVPIIQALHRRPVRPGVQSKSKRLGLRAAHSSSADISRAAGPTNSNEDHALSERDRATTYLPQV